MSRSVLAKLTVSILLVVSVLPVMGQDLDAEFEEEFPDDPLTYVALGPGFTATYIFMELDRLNELARSFEVDEFGGPLSVYGGGVVFTPIFLPNVRVAAHAFGGYHRSSRPKRIDSVVYNRTLRFGIRFQGMAGVDYAFPITKNFTVLPGIKAGWGSYALEFTQSREEEVPFSDVWDPNRYAADTAATMAHHNNAVRMINYHAFVYPTLQLEYVVMSGVMLRGSVGYHYALLDDEWTNEAETIYSGVPEINANGPTIEAGIFIGLFFQ